MLMKESASFSNLRGRSRDATGRSQESSRQSQLSGDWYQQDNDLISSFDNRASNGNDMDAKSSFRSLTIIPAPVRRVPLPACVPPSRTSCPAAGVHAEPLISSFTHESPTPPYFLRHSLLASCPCSNASAHTLLQLFFLPDLPVPHTCQALSIIRGFCSCLGLKTWL